MNLANQNIITLILIYFIPGVFAITLHECAHGWMALRLGDTTARDEGRLSLNPIRHIDPVGTLAVPALMILFHMPFVFGWAKPVPVDFQKLKGGRIGTILVALAGPLANLLMMLSWLAVAIVAMDGKSLETALNSPTNILAQMAIVGTVVNLILMIFNLIPIPPLDGGRILGALLPQKLSRFYMHLDRFGMILLLILIATGIFGYILNPLIDFFLSKLPS